MHAPTALHLEDVHSADGALALATMLFGVMAVLLVTFGQRDATQVGTIVGAVGVVAGLSGQYLSRHRSERFVEGSPERQVGWFGGIESAGGLGSDVRGQGGDF